MREYRVQMTDERVQMKEERGKVMGGGKFLL